MPKYTGGYSSLGLIVGMVSQLYDFGNFNARKVSFEINDFLNYLEEFTLE